MDILWLALLVQWRGNIVKLFTYSRETCVGLGRFCWDNTRCGLCCGDAILDSLVWEKARCGLLCWRDAIFESFVQMTLGLGFCVEGTPSLNPLFRWRYLCASVLNWTPSWIGRWRDAIFARLCWRDAILNWTPSWIHLLERCCVRVPLCEGSHVCANLQTNNNM